jgi:hypothetical protein
MGTLEVLHNCITEASSNIYCVVSLFKSFWVNKVFSIINLGDFQFCRKNHIILSVDFSDDCNMSESEMATRNGLLTAVATEQIL